MAPPASPAAAIRPESACESHHEDVGAHRKAHGQIGGRQSRQPVPAQAPCPVTAIQQRDTDHETDDQELNRPWQQDELEDAVEDVHGAFR